MSNQVHSLNGGTALHCAAQCGYVEGVAKLLARHPNMIDAVDNKGRTALHIAAIHSQNDVMRRLLAVASPRVINAVCEEGDTALLCMACRGRYDFAEQLLDVMSPEAISASDRQMGRTVLHWAASRNFHKLVARLLAMSPGLIDKVTAKGETVLHVSVHLESIAEMLLAVRPGMVHAVDNKGNTILHCAVDRSGPKETDGLGSRCCACPELGRANSLSSGD